MKFSLKRDNSGFPIHAAAITDTERELSRHKQLLRREKLPYRIVKTNGKYCLVAPVDQATRYATILIFDSL